MRARITILVTVGGHFRISGLTSIVVFCPFSRQKKRQTQKGVLNMASSDSQIDKPQHGRPKRAELPSNINTGAQSINTESL